MSQLYVRIPIDYRGNSPRFEYRPVVPEDLEPHGGKVRWCWEHRAFAPHWGECDVKRHTNVVGYGPSSACNIIDAIVIPAGVGQTK